MTNKAYFISQLGFAPSTDAIEAALTDAGLDGDLTYVTGNRDTLKKAALDTIQILLSTADITQGTGETMNSVKYDRAALLKRMEQLEDDLGLTSKPTIKARHIW